jgi:hypothetical protein
MLDEIAENLVDRDPDFPRILNESTQLSVELQELVGFHGTRNWKQTRKMLMEASSRRKMSSDIFTFRLVCKSFAASGLRVFLRKAREERWKHYLTFNLPRRLDSLWDLYAGLELMEPRPIATAITELKVHVLPSYAMVPKLMNNFFEDVDVSDAECRNALNDDANRIWQSRVHEQDALFQRAHHYQQALSQLLKHVETLTIEYKDFICRKQTRGSGVLVRQNWRSSDMLSFALFVAEHLTWTHLKLLNIGAFDLQAQDRAIRDSGIILSPTGQRCQALEITFSNRDDGERDPLTQHQLEARTEGTLFLNSFRNLREFTVSIDDHWGLRPGTLPWLKNALTTVRWPWLRKLSISRCRMTSVTLVNFLGWHKSSLEEVILRGVWTHRFSPNGHSMEHVIECLEEELDMRDVTDEEDRKEDFNERYFAHFVKKHDDVVMED